MCVLCPQPSSSRTRQPLTTSRSSRTSEHDKPFLCKRMYIHVHVLTFTLQLHVSCYQTTFYFLFDEIACTVCTIGGYCLFCCSVQTTLQNSGLTEGSHHSVSWQRDVSFCLSHPSAHRPHPSSSPSSYCCRQHRSHLQHLCPCPCPSCS